MKIINKVSLAGVFLSISTIAFCCTNDLDVIKFEEQRFPSIENLASGNFIQHSKDLYQWRIKDRSEKIKNDPNNLSNYDDLSVAYEKTGQTSKAIEVMEVAMKKDNKRYQTLANLGTFYIHDHQYARVCHF